MQLLKTDRGTTTVLGSVKSKDFVSNLWVIAGVRADGDRLRVSLYRGDTNQYLAADGTWTRQPGAAIDATDKALRSPGQVGFARNPAAAGKIEVDSLRVGPAADGPATVFEERFSRGDAVGLPPGWTQWTRGPVTATTSPDETLRVTAGATAEARAWVNRMLPADAQVSSSVQVNNAVPAGLFARGSNTDTARPTYYTLEVARGLQVTLAAVVNGQRTELAALRSKDYLNNVWVQASLVLSGDQLRAQLYRSDTGQYLNADGTWGLAPAWALTTTDRRVTGGGTAGLTRGSGYAGQLIFDNFIVTTAPAKNAKAGAIPTEADKPTTPVTPRDDAPRPAVPPASPKPTPPVVPPNPLPPAAPPPATAPTTANPNLPAVPQHHDWIRLAELAYYGTPINSPTEQQLLRDSVDLVIPNTAYLADIHAVAPATPQFVYTNVSNIYLDLITDWTQYADAHGLDREGAFYHAAKATSYNGASASSVPVNRFWGVYSGSGNAQTDLTAAAKNATTTLPFPAGGDALSLGYIEKFRELNVDLQTGARGGWTGQLEYVSAADANGNPTRWSKLSTLADGTNRFQRDGRVTFDPPRDWVAASVGGSSRLFYVRIRATGGGTAPVAKTILGRDYAAGGKVQAFDDKADANRDGYLSDAEYAKRRPGFDARFLYESRLYYPNYGTLRYATNVSNAGFRGWAADYSARYLKTQPFAAGYFVDNSSGRLAFDPATVKENLDGYAADYGSLLGAINKKLSATGKWLIANTAGGGASAEPIIRNGVSNLEEYALRPLSANHVQFDDLLATLHYRRTISGGRAYEILDTLPTNGYDANDPRVQLTSLAMYYAVADQNLSFLMLNGGNEPASTWARHYTDAIQFNVGKAKDTASLFATGTDPANRSLTYKVYQRHYANAMVLYKPVSYTRGVTGGTGNNTGTVHQLDGLYRAVRADGTLGPPVRSVTLRNGEGVILAKVK